MADPLPDLSPESASEPKYNTADYIAFGCLTTVVSLVLAAVIVALLISTRTYRADLFRDAVGPAIDNAPMIAEHKQQMKDDLDQVLEAYRAEQFEIEQLQEVAMWFSTSEYLVAAAVYGLSQEQVQQTSWPTEQKLRAQHAFVIYAHLVLAGAIDEKTNERVARKLREEAPGGGWSWEKEYNDQLLDSLLQELEANPAVAERLAAMDAVDAQALQTPNVPAVMAREINAQLGREVITRDGNASKKSVDGAGDELVESAAEAERSNTPGSPDSSEWSPDSPAPARDGDASDITADDAELNAAPAAQP